MRDRLPSPPKTRRYPAKLRRQLCQLPAFRGLLRAVEADFYSDLPQPAPLLDLGCGDGHFAATALSQKPTVGLDPWWPALKEARARRNSAPVTYAVGAHLPFPDAYFATVVSNSVLEHIPDLTPVIHEVSRVLKPGGWFYFCVPGPNFRRFLSGARLLDALKLPRLAEAYRRLFDRISRQHHYDTPAIWDARLSGAGLRMERWWPYFSATALVALEWGHFLGLPSLIAKKLCGRWLLVPQAWNLSLTSKLLQPLYTEPLPTEGAYLFFVAQKEAQ